MTKYLLIPLLLFAQIIQTGPRRKIFNAPPVGILDEWPMDDGGSGTFVDQAPTNPTNITVANCTVGAVTGFSGTPCTFAGAGGSAAAPVGTANYNLDGSTAFSICALIRPSSFTSTENTILSTVDPSFSFPGYALEVTNGGNLQFLIIQSGPTLTQVVQTGSLSTATTVPVCVTYAGVKNGTGTTFYVNGSPVASTIPQGNFTTTSASNRVGIGNRNPTTGSASNQFYGTIGWVSVWSCNLSSGVISTWSANIISSGGTYTGLHC